MQVLHVKFVFSKPIIYTTLLKVWHHEILLINKLFYDAVVFSMLSVNCENISF